ncbi:MAG: ATP-binding protein [Archangium sp.]
MSFPGRLGQWVWNTFLPPHEADSRGRKLIALLLTLCVVCAASLVVQAFQGLAFAAGGTLGMLLVCMLALIGHRRGVSRALIVSIVITIGIGVCGAMALAAGREGIGSLMWMPVAPLLALATSGRKAGWATLVAAIVVSTAVLMLMDRDVVPAAALEAHPLNRRITTVFFVCTAIFLVARAYEIETEKAIEALRSKNLKLIAAQQESERATLAKNQFLATISHELRTPLNGLIGMAAALADERRPERLEEGLRIVRTSADTLLAVIDDVLDFSKIEAGRLSLESIPLSVAAEATSVVELFRVSAEQRRNTLALRIAPEVPEWLRGDPTRLRQIVLNLVGNAVKFTEGGLIQLLLTMEGERVRLDVKDTGEGMTPEVLARIGAPFVQADASTTRRHGGTGLGLVITRRLIDAMGGELRIASTPGAGSTFTVLLPVVVCESPTPRASNAQRTARLSILVVDDNTVNQLVAQRLLQRLGHEVTVANDGAEALRVVQQRPFDLVLMDCHMPVMDGYEATRQLRARGLTIPIFALTAAVSFEDQAECLRSGMNRVLTKPLRVDHLHEALNSVEPSAAAA